MNIVPITLADKTDTCSILVPCLGFSDPAAFSDYSADGVSLLGTPFHATVNQYSGVSFGSKHYAPRNDLPLESWFTTMLFNTSKQPGSWKTLRQRKIRMPSSDAFNVCLLVDGPRQFHVSNTRTPGQHDAWYKLNAGFRDCFVAWGRVNGEPIGKENSLRGENNVVAATQGRGVVFTRVAGFSSLGEFLGWRNTLLKVQFAIRDTNPRKDDMLNFQVCESYKVERQGDTPCDFAKDESDHGWKILIERAQKGFAQCCQTVPRDLDNWRRFFADQIAHLHNDRQTEDGSSYRDQIKHLNWQQALEEVYFPWQLQVVIDIHGRKPEFDESQHRAGSNCTRVGKMLATHECSNERRAQLRAMVDNFVRYEDTNWNFVRG